MPSEPSHAGASDRDGETFVSGSATVCRRPFVTAPGALVHTIIANDRPPTPHATAKWRLELRRYGARWREPVASDLSPFVPYEDLQPTPKDNA